MINNINPHLRFKGFNSDWEFKPLSHFLTEHRKISSGNEDVFSVSVHKGLINQIEHLGRSYASSNTSKYKLVMPNDVIYTKSPTGDFPFGIVKQSKISDEVIVSPLYGVFTPKNKNIGFLIDAYFSFPKTLHKFLEPIIQKGAKNTINISNEKFLSKAIALPSDELEQEKIVKTLTSIDELISASEQKLKLLEKQKKGLLQNLFPQNEETIPRFRFPQFANSQEWEIKKLSEVAKHSKSKNKTNSIDRIFTNSATLGVIDQSEYFDRDIANKNNLNTYFIVEKDYFVYNPRISVSAPVGPISRNKIGQGVMSPLYTVFNITEGDKDFFEHYFKTSHWHNYLKSISNMGARHDRMSISNEAFFEMPIPVPDENEQIKIAQALNNIETIIDLQQLEVRKLKEHKQGLIQQLFPKI